METVKKLFPLSTSCSDNESFIRNLIIYVVAIVICSLIFSLLGKIPLLGIVFSILGWVVDLYLVVGIVLAVLLYFNILK
jgi:uncharacterized membrane protein YkvI